MAKLCFFLLAAFSLCSQCAGTIGAQSEFVMGTFCRIDLFENGNAGLYTRLFARLAELEMILSANRDDSELAKINRNAGLKAAAISPELFTVLERSLYFAEATGGAFDPTVGPLVKLWGIGTETPHLPSDEEVSAALALVDFRNLELIAGASGKPGTAFLKQQGMALDLGAIAKGFAADELALVLQEAGVKRAIIDLGGNIYVWGKKPNEESWHIGVQDPNGERGVYTGVLELAGSISVVSSGTYERFFMGNDGKRYHHIFALTKNGQGKKGYPAENGVLSTTVIAASSMDADALSTSCFVLGYEKGMDLARANGAEVLYIMEKNAQTGEKTDYKAIYGSPGAMAMFTPAEDY